MGAIKRKQAAKVDARKAIELASERSKATIAEREIFRKKIEESNLAREIEGKNSLSNLRRLGEKKLPRGAEITIARHLHPEWLMTKRHMRITGISMTKFCIRARITSSKEIHRLTLPSDKSPTDVRPRRSASKYFWFIKAISETTGESTSALADRVLLGTSLHPLKMGNLSETEIVHATLQRIVDKIDDQFHIHSKFMEIADLKAEHIAAGGTESWPLWQVTPDLQSTEEYEQELAFAADKRFAFWKRRVPSEADSYGELPLEVDPSWPWPHADDSGVMPDIEFFYIPHAPLGVIEFADFPNRQSARAKYEKAVQCSLDNWRRIDEATGQSRITQEYAVRDDWDPEKECPVGQFAPRDHYGEYFAWIIMYPMRDGSRLMPMLYISYEEGMPYMVPLDVRNLDIFRDAIWLNETEHMSVFSRIKELLDFRRPETPGAIEDGLRKTAPWLDHSPFFKMRRHDTEELQMLNTNFHQLWDGK